MFCLFLCCITSSDDEGWQLNVNSKSKGREAYSPQEVPSCVHYSSGSKLGGTYATLPGAVR